MGIDEADLVPRKLAQTYQDSKLDLYVQGVHLDRRVNGGPLGLLLLLLLLLS
jgi:hypothetical protein